MPYGYSYLDALWKKKEKLEVLKKASYREATIWAFFHSLIFVSLGATLFVIVSYLIFYGTIRSDIYILILIAIFSPFVTQSIIRKYLYIKYGYYKNIFSKLGGVLGSILMLFFFILLMIKVSKEISMPLLQTFKYFLMEYVGLVVINLAFFQNPIKNEKRT